MADDTGDVSDDDPVIEEVDVFLSKSLADNLYVMQYPMRPQNMGYDQFDHMAVRVKPQQKKIELTLALDTRSSNYSSSKGEQIAVNVDGSLSYDSNERYFSGCKMNKIKVSCEPATEAFTGCQYAVGLFKDGELHLTPVTPPVSMKPHLDYLDTADTRCKAEAAANLAADGGESSQDECEEEATLVNMKVARGESEEFRARRMASYEYIHRRREEEAWLTVAHHGADSGVAESERMQLLCGQTGAQMETSQFQVSPQDFLQALVPAQDQDKSEAPAMPHNVLSLSDLRKLELKDQIKALLMNVKVIRFSQLISFLCPGTDHQAVLRCLQMMAVLVQGCWVIKSELLYPDEDKDSMSSTRRSVASSTAVSPELLRRVRDYAMWKFTHCKYVVRKDISSIVQLSSDDVKEILEKMSRLRARSGWEFLYGYDRDFCERHPEIVQRQRTKWALTYQGLAQNFTKLPKDGDKKALELEMTLMNLRPSERQRTRRHSSRSLSPRKRTLSGRSMSDYSDMETDPSSTNTSATPTSTSTYRLPESAIRTIADVGGGVTAGTGATSTMNGGGNGAVDAASALHHQNNVNTMDTTETTTTTHPQNNNNNGVVDRISTTDIASSGGDSTSSTADVLMRELEKFIRATLAETGNTAHVCMSELRSKMSLYTGRVATARVFSAGVSDRLLEEAVVNVGGFRLRNQWPPNKRAEQIFTIWSGNDKTDKLRKILYSLFEEKHSIKFATFRQAVLGTEAMEMSEAEMKKFLKDHCDTHAALYYLKKTLL